MKSKKNVSVSLSIFIGIIFVLTLFGQQQGPLWNTINDLKSRVAELETAVSDLQTQMGDANAGIGNLETRLDTAENNITTLQNDLSNHTHDYSDLTGTPTILSEEDVINLIVDYALLRQPDYDSGWQSFIPGEATYLDHYVGGNIENYFVYFQFKANTGPIHCLGYGRNFRINTDGTYSWEGGYYSILNNVQLVYRIYGDGTIIDQVRFRIWKLD